MISQPQKSRTQLGFAFLLAFAMTSAALSAQSSGPTVRWEVDDQGVGWTCANVAIGDHGSVVITSQTLLNGAVVIYSGTSPQPFAEFNYPETPDIRVAAAKKAQTLAALIATEEQNPFSVNPILHVWHRARDGAPDWSYRFPATTDKPTTIPFTELDVHISDDGQVVAAWYTDRAADLVYLRVFNRQGQLLLDLDLANSFGGNAVATNAQMTPDGSRLLFDMDGRPYLYRLNSGHLLEEWNDRSERGGLAISDDGKTVAIGDLNLVSVYREDSNGNFNLAHSFPLQGSRFGGPLALDSDGSHIAYSVNWDSRFDKVQIRCHELAQGTELWRNEIVAPNNTNSLWVSDIQMAEDAAIVATSNWGATVGNPPTGVCFNSQGDPIGLFHTEGSALDLDFDSASGLVAFGTRDRHVFGFGNGGDVICADVQPVELSISGLPELGGSMNVEIQGTGTHARIAVSLALGDSQTPYGVSQLDLNSLALLSPALTLPANGLQINYSLPGNPALSGIALHAQAAIIDTSLGQGYLSNRVSLRVLP